MRILENPNPTPNTVHICEKCQCKFEYTEKDVIKHTDSDANGRIGGTHYYSYQESVNCPNCGEPYIIKRESGYSSSCISHQIDDDEIANKFKDKLISMYDENLANKWTIYIFPSVNPDGEYHGWTHNGPGRTTVYSNAPTHQGIDMNRTWSTDWVKYASDRNQSTRSCRYSSRTP